MKLSNEFLLAAACCRWPPSCERDEAVCQAASRGIDWARFTRIVRRQRVEGLVSDALRRSALDVPAGIASALHGEAGRIARQNLIFAAESLRIQQLLTSACIPFLFVKGVTLDMLAYGSLGLKRARDIDLVVAPDRLEQACGILADAGYVRSLPGLEVGPKEFLTWISLCKETNWRHPRNGVLLELHTSLVDNPRLLPSVGAHSPRQWVEIRPGARLPTLAKEELFSYLCVHGATHAWSRLKWIADVAALLKDSDLAEVDRLYRQSLELGAGRCSGQALLLCRQLFELPLPLDLTEELRKDPALCRLVRIALSRMAGGDAEETELDETVLGTVPIHLSHFLLARGWRYKLSEMRRKSLSHHDRTTIPLPGPLRFLYPLLLMPSWLWRRAKGAAPH